MIKKLFSFGFILAISIGVYGQATISGTISDSVGVASSGRVKLFRATGKFVDSLDFTSGIYSFSNVPLGNYYVVTRGDTAAYPNHIITYYGQKPRWETATKVTVSDTIGVDSVDITLIQIPNWSGSNNKGYCSGTIVTGTGNRAGDPIPGIDISLEQIPGGIIKANTETNNNGFFEIKKIPNNTQYSLSVDIPGIAMDSTHTVTIMTEDTVTQLDFIVDTAAATAGIYVAAPITSVFSFKKKGYNEIKVFPNPSYGVFVVELLSEECKISVVAIDGKIIFKNNIYSNKARIDLSNQPKGIYFIQIEDSVGIHSLKVLVE